MLTRQRTTVPQDSATAHRRKRRRRRRRRQCRDERVYSKDAHAFITENQPVIARRLAAHGKKNGGGDGGGGANVHVTLYREGDWGIKTARRAMLGFRSLPPERTFATFRREFERAFPHLTCVLCTERWRRLRQRPVRRGFPLRRASHGETLGICAVPVRPTSASPRDSVSHGRV